MRGGIEMVFVGVNSRLGGGGHTRIVVSGRAGGWASGAGRHASDDTSQEFGRVVRPSPKAVWLYSGPARSLYIMSAR